MSRGRALRGANLGAVLFACLLLLTIAAFAVERVARSSDDLVNTVVLSPRLVRGAGRGQDRLHPRRAGLRRRRADHRRQRGQRRCRRRDARDRERTSPPGRTRYSVERRAPTTGSRAPPGLYALEVVLGEQDRDVKPPGRIEMTNRRARGLSGERRLMDEPLLWIGTLALRARRRRRADPALRPPDPARGADRSPSCSRPCSSSPTAGTAARSPTCAIARRCCSPPPSRPRSGSSSSAGSSGGGRSGSRRSLIAAMPFRVPIDLGGGDANLLLPLYAVIAGGLAAALCGAWRDPEPERAGRSERGPWIEAIGWALAGSRRPLRAPGRLRRRPDSAPSRTSPSSSPRSRRSISCSPTPRWDRAGACG